MKKKLCLCFLFVIVIFTTSNASKLDSLFQNLSSKLEWAKGFRFNGYAQIQYQYAQEVGIKSYSGGNFDSLTNNRFSIRRGRMIPTYEWKDPKTEVTRIHFSIQADFTERGVQLMHVYGRFTEPFTNWIGIQGGLFNRPFGFEIGYTSRTRETPERGRMSQKLFPQERDLGGMIILEAPPKSKFHFFKLEAGIFNGMGLTPEVDKRKDFVGKFTLLKTIKFDTLSKNVFDVSVGASMLRSGVLHMSPISYSWGVVNDSLGTMGLLKSTDSTLIKNEYAPKNYWGVDAQLKFEHKYQKELRQVTELRGELIGGTLSGTLKSTDAFKALNKDPLASRNFLGGYFYLVESFYWKKEMGVQLALKYDFFDPNTKIKGLEIGKNPVTNTGEADVKFQTVELSYSYIYNSHWKVMLAYAMPFNEKTSVKGYESDVRDNVLTLRLQFGF